MQVLVPADGPQFISDNALRSCLSGTKYWILAVDSVRYNANEMGGDAFRYDNGIAKKAKELTSHSTG